MPYGVLALCNFLIGEADIQTMELRDLEFLYRKVSFKDLMSYFWVNTLF